MSHVLYVAPAPNVPYFVPHQYPPAGTAVDPQPNGEKIPTLFRSITIRGVTFQNRLWLAPLAQYSAENGFISPWHLAHLGGIFTRGPGLSMVEATAILPEGRVSPEDAGIWNNDQANAWAKIVEFAHSQGQKIGIQLAHGGRKSSTLALFIHSGAVAEEHQGGWPKEVVGPSPLAYAEGYPVPKELTKVGIRRIVVGFVEAAKRAVKAGFDVIEIHGAHGFLISSFLSPTSNKRTDEYGGSFENRIRLAIEVVDAVRGVIPPTMPLFIRISATEWLEESLPNEPSWRSEDTVKLASILAEHGVDLIDISSSGNHPAQRIKTGPAYQAPFSEAVKKAVGDKILVSVVGSITDGKIAQGILDKGQSDIIFVGRWFQKNPSLVWTFADDLGVELRHSRQIEWPFRGRGQPTDKRERL
ncbi:FMN-linked oxidoreductase [Dichomitus squalens]|uniref:FMN-linked oxidoreductase n=1 Tax=Dichomitus squalens TaxID=114155 RepID=A0A4Q9M5Y2_9APHY|nr:FMN-linked oxidoreductase [Dichomitus squalens]